MKKKFIVLGLALIVALYGIFTNNITTKADVGDLKISKGKVAAYLPKENVKVKDYVRQKRAVLEQRSKQDSETEVIATISFSKWLTIDEVLEVLNAKGIQPVSVLYTFRGQGLGSGEMRAGANAAETKENWETVMKVRLDDFESQLKRDKGFTDSPDSMILLEKTKEQARKKVTQVKNATPIISAVKVTAKLGDLKNLASNKNIRLIDVADEDAVQELKSAGIPETNVLLPEIIPDDIENFTGVPKEID